MPEEHANQENVSGGPRVGVDPWFLYVAGGLLLVIVAALGGLSLRFYRRAVAAESQLDAVARQPGLAPWIDMLGKQGAATSRVQREALRRRSAWLDGKAVTLLEVDALQGLALGLWPDDLLLVGPRPDAQPATGAATRPATRPELPLRIGP